MAKEKKKKIYKKKLTSSGAGAVTLTLIAALLSVAAAAGDFIATAVYNGFYDNPIKHFFAGDAEAYIHQYSLGVTMSVLSVIMFIWAVSGARSKKIGREFGFIGLCLPAAICAVPGYDAVTLALGKATEDAFATGYDGDKFRAVMNIAVNGVPALAGILLMIAGIVVLMRMSDEDFRAEVPKADKKKAAPKGAVIDEGPDPLSFGGHNDEPAAAKPTEKEPAARPAGEAMAEEKVIAEPIIEEKPAPKKELRICMKCGTIAEGEEKFCSNCGALL